MESLPEFKKLRVRWTLLGLRLWIFAIKLNVFCFVVL
jgi:hypothetical protein